MRQQCISIIRNTGCSITSGILSVSIPDCTSPSALVDLKGGLIEERFDFILVCELGSYDFEHLGLILAFFGVNFDNAVMPLLSKSKDKFTCENALYHNLII